MYRSTNPCIFIYKKHDLVYSFKDLSMLIKVHNEPMEVYRDKEGRSKQPSPSVHEQREQGRVTLYQGHQELASFSALLNVDEEETDFAAMLEDQLLADEESSSPSVSEQEEQPMILSQSEQPMNWQISDDQEIGTVEDSSSPREKQLEFPKVKVDDEELRRKVVQYATSIRVQLEFL
ncbi:OLC1v1019008C1 [Oldenlandia corymbosa var. corymbosa]|uniref:OLC1v1019008C1 n=1 Tax=Oldenlandia corymbosa var. corymbosa TaxID=529605 RepID=A0AAV1ED15_OLDCO|nr:OLC1v1019008C1 [Oldenlandia corymbosa var. corymbosa]